MESCSLALQYESRIVNLVLDIPNPMDCKALKKSLDSEIAKAVAEVERENYSLENITPIWVPGAVIYTLSFTRPVEEVNIKDLEEDKRLEVIGYLLAYKNPDLIPVDRIAEQMGVNESDVTRLVDQMKQTTKLYGVITGAGYEDYQIPLWVKRAPLKPSN